MSIQQKKPILVAGVVERPENHLLIVLAKGPNEVTRQWQFPRGDAGGGESPEAAMRRVAREQLGLAIDIVVGQPPLVSRIDGREVELRYFFCGDVTDEANDAAPGDMPSACPYAEIHWIPRIHLQEYDFDEPSRPVVEFLLEERR